MKQAFFKRIVAVCLIVSTAMTTSIASAAPAGRGKKGNKYSGYTESTQQETTSSSSETTTTMTLVESEDTVTNGEELRASTYLLTTTADDGSDDTATTSTSTSTVLKYFPVTMYDYDATTINAATDAKDDDLTVREGIYFSGGSPDYTKETTTDYSALVEGQYYIQNIRADKNGVGSWLVATTNDATGSYKIAGTTIDSTELEPTLWTLVIEDGEDSAYYLTCTINNETYYMIVGTDGDSDGLSETKTPITISAFSGDIEGVQLSQDGYYLNHWGAGNSQDYGGYNNNNDDGNGMKLYRVEDDGSQTLTTLITTETIISGYEAWNSWNKASGNNDNGQKTWTGLVESALDANKDIVFTKPEGGIFDSNTDVKSIYTNVELPFVYANGFYTFDASVNGVYFHEDSTQGSSGTAANNTRLYFNEGTTQSNGGGYGDGSTTVWLPYNDSTSISKSNYHFGMRATIPFAMTTNGRIKETDDTSEAIKFSFSGDDDVWVFIDGQLVIDLGGIHNRLDATIDFAANTVTYSKSNSLRVETGSYNDESFELTQTLFGGLISQDRTSFAATDSHELTVFYLERGEGASNCKIEFNLPMKDTVTVTKHATQSWTDNGTEEGAITSLTAKEQAIVDNIPFGFTLYKSTDGGTTYSTVANTNYYLLNANGQIIATPATDANGHFYLKNSQSAKFITEFDDEDGTTYYVVEDDVSSLGFVTPDYNFGGESVNGFVANDTAYTKGNEIPEQILDTEATSNKSYEVTVKGSDESEDSLVFICENYLDAKLPNPSARPAEDRIVIDYGLPVEIDVLANDLYRGDSIELISVSGAGLVVDAETGEVTTDGGSLTYGSATISNGKIVYTLNKQMTGVEVINYIVKVTGSTTQETIGTVYTAYEYAVATVYVIPATTMYYEENFAYTENEDGTQNGGLVTYTGSNWVNGFVTNDTYVSEYQEPGVVGDHTDSPYGSDVAYLNDSCDSNGTSKYADTSGAATGNNAGAVQFSYTFTGTGTSFFARTSDETGYMQIVIRDEDGNVVQGLYRNTYYNDTNDSTVDDSTADVKTTLYNVPVFTSDELDYGTYTVTVIVARENTTKNYHKDFYLDGIRIVQPLNIGKDEEGNYLETDEKKLIEIQIAEAAYAADSEANASIVTLRQKLVNVVADEDGNEEIVWQDGNYVVFTDTNDKVIDASEYVSNGPKEEVYINAGQSVSFALKSWDANNLKIYMGMKAPLGTATVEVNGTTIVLNNSVDGYYDISSLATITDSEDGEKIATFVFKSTSGIVSLTNIKVTGTYEFAIIPEENIEV